MEKPVSKKKAKEVKPSKKKPEIRKGINAVDLNSWFYSKDLSSYCEKKGIPDKGTKRELVKRILDHLDGKDVSIKPKAPKKKKAPKKGKGTKKAAGEKDAGEKKEGGKRKAEESSEEPKGKKAK